MLTLDLLPPGHPENSADREEWDLPPLLDVTRRLLGPAPIHGHPEWALAKLAGAREVQLRAEDTAWAEVTFQAFTFHTRYRLGPDADSDPACLVRLERVLAPKAWAQAHWSACRPGQVIYLWRYGGLCGSRGSKSLDEPFLGVSWERLDAAWALGELHVLYG